MNKLRIFTVISLLIAAVNAWGCSYHIPQSVDNMIYRLVEDVSPYYYYEYNHALLYPQINPTEADNLALWRQQTQSKVSDDQLRWYVYKASAKELAAKKSQAVTIFGEDGYRLLTLAKEVEAFRNYITDPWYYPVKSDTMVTNIEKRLPELTAYRGRYASRYALQSLRVMVALKKYEQAVKYWEKVEKTLPKDIVKDMAERHVARAYLITGDKATASTIYARQGDLNSLEKCGLTKEEKWNVVYEQCPDSPFFVTEIQFLLTRLDNRYYEENIATDCAKRVGIGTQELEEIDIIMKLADRAIREKKVKDVAMWYYTKAALQNITGQVHEAGKTVYKGLNTCKEGTFLANSMRVLRILIEAERCAYTSQYQRTLAHDLIWLDLNGRKNLTPAVKERFQRKQTVDNEYGHFVIDNDVDFTNKYYWNDVINRILVSVLVPQLVAQGKTVDALLYANLGEFWIMKNVYGKADCPNEPCIELITNHNNAMAKLAYTCPASDLVKMLSRLYRPTCTIDRMVLRYGMVDMDYWRDMIGTRYIAEKNYSKAVIWLKGISREAQRNLSTWDYFNRDPFFFDGTGKYRYKTLNNRYDYKLRFAEEMAALEKTFKTSKNADERAEAMIRYGIGLRNQKENCWALSRYSDTNDNYYAMREDPERYGNFIDISDSEDMIRKGIKTFKDRERKAYYLHVFVRNREVMKYYGDTQTAANLRAHCDLWRDYK